MLLLLIVILLLFGFGGGYWGHRRYGDSYSYAGPSFGLGTVLVILLVVYLLGGFSLPGLRHF